MERHGATVFTGEATAIRLVLEHIMEQGLDAGREVVVFSDALSVIQALETQSDKQSVLMTHILEIVQQSAAISVTVVWIPSHVQENAFSCTADMLAKTGLSQRQVLIEVALDAK